MKRSLIILGIIIIVVIGGYKVYKTTNDNQKTEDRKTVDTDNTLINILIENSWSEEELDSLLGEYEKIISRPTDLVAGGPVIYYQTYYNDGLKVQFTNNEYNNHIYSLIFNNEFQDTLIGEIDMNSSFEDITSIYDKPHFVNEDIGLIGYKLEHYYIFFVGKENIEEISMYPRMNYDKTVINKAIKAYDKTKVPSDFIDVLWKDYDYSSGESALSIYNYDNRGIVVESEDTGTDDNSYVKLKIYGNYIGEITDKISLPDDINNIKDEKKDLINQGIELLLDEDSIYNCELERLEEYNKLKGELADTYGEKSPDGDIFVLNLFSMYTGNRLKLYDANKENLLTELWGVDNYGWINDRYLIYSQSNKYDEKTNDIGIHIYDCNNGKQIEVINSESILLSWDNDIIIYAENGQKQIEHRIKYEFDKNGNISFENSN
ncbi:hypothetical protein AN1V17_35080 [Vallitalea sediminicola]